MSEYSLGVLAVAAMFLMTIAPVTGQRNGGAAEPAGRSGQGRRRAGVHQRHGVNNITNSWGATKADWRQTFDSMVKLPDRPRGDHRHLSRGALPGESGSAEDSRRAR